jgi:hypothetical protein
MVEPETNRGQQRHDDDHAEQQSGDIRRAELSDTRHTPSILSLAAIMPLIYFLAVFELTIFPSKSRECDVWLHTVDKSTCVQARCRWLHSSRPAPFA